MEAASRWDLFDGISSASAAIDTLYRTLMFQIVWYILSHCAMTMNQQLHILILFIHYHCIFILRQIMPSAKLQVSSWHVPAEVAELRKNQESGSTEGSATQLQDASTQGDKVSAPSNIAAPAAQIGAHDSMALRSSGAPVSSSALDMVKKKLQEAGTPMTSPHSTSVPATSDANGLKATEAVAKGVINKDKSKDANGEGNMSDSSSESDDEESGPSKEECIIQFKVIISLVNYEFLKSIFYWT